jgi:hypothetical protein
VVDEMIKTFYDPKVEERGIQKGEQRGRLNTKREDILELLEEVGTISEDIKKLVEKEEDIEVLRKWLKIVLMSF